MLPRIVRGVARGQGLDKRVRTVATVLACGPSVLPTALRGRCEVAIRFAVRLGLGPRVGRARFVEDADLLLADALAPSVWDRVLASEPRPVARVGASQQRAVAELLADFADLKSVWTQRRSSRPRHRTRPCS